MREFDRRLAGIERLLAPARGIDPALAAWANNLSNEELDAWEAIARLAAGDIDLAGLFQEIRMAGQELVLRRRLDLAAIERMSPDERAEAYHRLAARKASRSSRSASITSTLHDGPKMSKSK